MLIFFIHGVATRDVKYADDLKSLIREEFTKRGEPLPHFHASFWGNVLNNVGNMWNLVHQDLQEFKKENPQANLDDVFRYKKFREGFLSQFVRDVLTYLSPVDDTLAELNFKHGSGTLCYIVNPLKVHHVYVFDSKECCKFGGYVGWLDTKALKEEIDFIKKKFLRIELAEIL